MTPEQILERADSRRESGMSTDAQILNMQLDVLDAVEKAREKGISGEDAVASLIFKMFER